jgi:hypothetical protein
VTVSVATRFFTSAAAPPSTVSPGTVVLLLTVKLGEECSSYVVIRFGAFFLGGGSTVDSKTICLAPSGGRLRVPGSIPSAGQHPVSVPTFLPVRPVLCVHCTVQPCKPPAAIRRLGGPLVWGGWKGRMTWDVPLTVILRLTQTPTLTLTHVRTYGYTYAYTYRCPEVGCEARLPVGVLGPHAGALGP